MTILDEIIANKKKEVALLKEKFSILDLEEREFFGRKVLSFKDFLLAKDRSGVIAEFKTKSPSKGIINATANPAQVTKAYNEAGASALSVLTDEQFFGGSNENLLAARRVNEIPILRKDFIIDEFQLLEAKSIGADIILLIASNLEVAQCKRLAKAAKALGLNVLLEVHDKAELKFINEFVDAVGVNNRNLNTFRVDIQTSIDLVNEIPNEFLKISESGIDKVETIKLLKEVGYQGFLIGENFMKEEDPGKACKNFIEAIRTNGR
ncbi:MAG: indole-3-glycerol phosphate synthase TrpC [Bacteroidetes bacterium]|nr:indole-3-glycerol phosphate synthase TrpC [Bacteroidota bacterium]